MRLEADGGATILHYDVKADIGGKLAQLGGSLVEKTAQKLAGEFFAKFETLLNPDGVVIDADGRTVVGRDSRPTAGSTAARQQAVAVDSRRRGAGGSARAAGALSLPLRV